MVQFDRTIPPGGEGKIELKVDTAGLSGTIRKEVTAFTNDPNNRVVTLALTATIKLSILINPKNVSLDSEGGETVSKSVTITANEDRALEIEPTQFKITGKVTYGVEVVEKGKIFKVNFEYTPVEGDNFRGSLILKTNYPEKPTISIPITARYQKRTTSQDKN